MVSSNIAISQSLFGHLAHKFGDHPENLATEALSYVLNRSLVARKALVRFIAQSGVDLSIDIRFQTQVSGADEAIPDLVGITPNNEVSFICEAKFWAGLTENQPITYLRRFSENAGGSLLFLAPSRRIATLWPELIRRCQQSGHLQKEEKQISSEYIVSKLSDKLSISLSSWRLLLNAMRHALETEGDMDMAADVRQLEGLCARMDSEAFLPLRSEELACSIGARNIQYNEIVNDVTDTLVANNKVSIRGLRATNTQSGYGRYMRVGPFGCMLQVNSSLWSRLRETPIWFSIQNRDEVKWAYSPQAKERLFLLESENPPRLLQEGDELLVPLFMPTGCERDIVVRALLVQLEEIITHLTGEKQPQNLDSAQ